MITRQSIINELNKLHGMSQEEKKQVISDYLDGESVEQSERDKILSDLISYEQY